MCEGCGSGETLYIRDFSVCWFKRENQLHFTIEGDRVLCAKQATKGGLLCLWQFCEWHFALQNVRSVADVDEPQERIGNERFRIFVHFRHVRIVKIQFRNDLVANDLGGMEGMDAVSIQCDERGE